MQTSLRTEVIIRGTCFRTKEWIDMVLDNEAAEDEDKCPADSGCYLLGFRGFRSAFQPSRTTEGGR